MEQKKDMSGESSRQECPETVAEDKKIKLYDFKRPDKFTRDQIRTLAVMHETFARLTSTALSSHLRCQVHSRVAIVDQLNYEEFIRALPNPALLAVVNMEPLKGSAVLGMDLPLSFCAIDYLFGGEGRGTGLNRDITDIEESVLEGMLNRILGNMRESWSTITDLRPHLAAIETNPLFAMIVPPTEMVVVITLEMKIGETAGKLVLCLPFLTIEPLIGKLSATYWYSAMIRGKNSKSNNLLQPKISSFQMDSLLYYQGEKISLEYLHKVKKGSCIKLSGYNEQEIFLECGGKTVMKLHREKSRNSGQAVFTVMNTAGIPVRRHASVSAHSENESADNERNVKALLSGMKEELGNLFRESMAGLNTNLQEIRKKQDELSDQIFFETAGTGEEHLAQNGTEINKQKPFGFITRSVLDGFFNIVCQEHPQTIALLLAYLPPELAGIILARLEPEIQPDIAERIVRLGKVSVEVIETTERILRKKMESLYLTSDWQVGGVTGMVNILDLAQRSLERNIINSLDQSNAALSEELKKRLFVFEDIVLLDKKALQKVLLHIDKNELALALKKTDPRVLAAINALLSKEEQESIKQHQEAGGPTRLKDIEEAQQSIVACIRELNEKGEIVVARVGETV